MEKELLLDIIKNGIDEIQQISNTFDKDKLKHSEIDIAIYKTETLLKEFLLLKEDLSEEKFSSENKIEDKSSKSIVNGKEKSSKSTTQYKNDIQKSTKKTANPSVTKNKSHNTEKQESLPKIAQHIETAVCSENKISPEATQEIISSISITEDKVIGETITSSTELSNLININDRFQFSRELFNNDTNLYNETISKLNMVSGFENAKKIISSFDWNEEDETVIRFLEILTRKFNYNV